MLLMGSTVMLSQSNRGDVVQNIPHVYINLVGPVDVNGFNELTEPMCKPNIRFALTCLYRVETVLRLCVWPPQLCMPMRQGAWLRRIHRCGSLHLPRMIQRARIQPRDSSVVMFVVGAACRPCCVTQVPQRQLVHS
jgi:hypothetical protein